MVKICPEVRQKHEGNEVDMVQEIESQLLEPGVDMKTLIAIEAVIVATLIPSNPSLVQHWLQPKWHAKQSQPSQAIANTVQDNLIYDMLQSSSANAATNTAG